MNFGSPNMLRYFTNFVVFWVLKTIGGGGGGGGGVEECIVRDFVTEVR